MKRLQSILRVVYSPALVMLVVFFAMPAFAGCPSAAQRMNNFLSRCYICNFSEVLLNAINTVATNSFVVMSGTNGPAIRLLAICFALWLVWHIGNMFINYKYSEPAEFINELGKCAIRVLFIATILAASAIIAVDFIISPIVSMATDIILSFVNTNLLSQAVQMGGITDYCSAAQQMSLSGDGKVLSPQIINSILCIIQANFAESVKGAVIGLSIQCVAKDAYPFILWLSFPDIGMWFIGTIIFLVFIIIMLSVSFSLIDFIMRIGFVVIIIPLVLVAWVFPITRHYTKKAWDLFLNSLVALLVITVTVGLIVRMVGSVLGGSDQIDYCINNNYIHDLYNIVYTNGVSFLLFVAILFISVLLTKSAPSVANHFVPITAGLASTNVGAAAFGKVVATTVSTMRATATLAATALTAGVGTGAAAAVKRAATATKGASLKIASKLGKPGQAAIKAGQKISAGAKKAAAPVKKAADKAKAGYNNIKQRIDKTKQGVANKLGKISRDLDKSGKAGHAILKMGKIARKMGSDIKDKTKEKFKKAPEKMLDKIEEKGNAEYQKGMGGA